MAERKYLPQSIAKQLEKEGLNLPTTPSKSGEPNPFIARCEPTNPSKLIDPEQQALHPQCGQMGTFGVFFADSLTSLPIQSNSTFYVFARDDVSTEWLCTSSLDWEKAIQDVAKKRKLNVTKIGDGLDAERVVYENHCVYQDKTGVCTTPSTVDLRLARLILIPKQYIDTIPSTLHNIVKPI